MPVITSDDGVNLFYRADDFRDPWARDATATTTVLMHHGFAKNLDWWTPCVPGIASHYPVVRYDARGCGKSSIPEKTTLTLDRLARDALNLLDSLEIERVHWAAFESGGLVACVFAANYPERTASVSLFNTPSGNWMTTGRMNKFFSVGYPNIAQAVDALGFEQWVTKTMDIWVDRSLATTRLVNWMKRQATSTPLPIAKAWLRMTETTDISNLPARVTVPTLLVAGKNHVYGCEPEELEGLRRLIPNAREIVYVPGVGSSVQLMAPDACTSALLSFWRSLEHA